MFIFAFFIVLSLSQFVCNKLINISDESESSYVFNKRDSLIIGSIFIISIALQVFSSKFNKLYWIILGVYTVISTITLIIMLQFRKQEITKQREQIQQVYEILQKLVDKKNQGLDFDNIPFSLGYKHGNIQKIKVAVEPTQFTSDPAKTIMAFIPQLNAFLPEYNWNYDLHLEERYIMFYGEDKPPTMARWPGGWLRPSTVFPVGISGSGELVWQPDSTDKSKFGRSLYLNEHLEAINIDDSLSRAPQGLIAGGTGGGKSVFVQNIILHALEHHDEVSVVLIDPKIVEFETYKDMKGIVAVANTTSEIVEVLRIGRAVMYKRNKELAALGCKQVSEYIPHDYSGKIYVCGREMSEDECINVKIDDKEQTMSTLDLSEQLSSELTEAEITLDGNTWISVNKNCVHKIYNDTMKRLIFVVDEVAEMTTKSGLKTSEAKDEDAMKDEAVTIISSIAQLGRSAAVHVLCCTQKPNASVIPTILRSNLGLRVFMGTAAEAGASQVTLDNTLATTIDSSHPGMGIMQVNAQPVFFRGYFSKFSDLEEYYRIRGLNELGYDSNSDSTVLENVSLEGDIELTSSNDKTVIDFESEHKEIDHRQEQNWEEV